MAGVSEMALGEQATLGRSLDFGSYSVLDSVDTTDYGSAILEPEWTDRLATFLEGLFAGGELQAGVGLVWRLNDVFSIDAAVGYPGKYVGNDGGGKHEEINPQGPYGRLGIDF